MFVRSEFGLEPIRREPLARSIDAQQVHGAKQ